MRTILLIAIGVLILFRTELSSAKEDGKNRPEHSLTTTSELNANASKAAVLAKTAMVEGSLAQLSSLFIGAALLFALLSELARRAPEGYEDATGFHLIRSRRVSIRRRSTWLSVFRRKKRAYASWPYPSPRRPLKA
jgi:hypothetical protein